MVFRSVSRVLVALYFLTSTVLAVDPSFTSFGDRDSSGGNFSVAINVPKNGTDDLFIHFNAPTTYQWAAFGLGDRMANSLMFIMYPSKDGKGVTLSPRTTTAGNAPPILAKDVTVQIYGGSGIVANGTVMLAKVYCKNCRKWTSGSIDITSSKANAIYALGPKIVGGQKLQSDDASAQISKHSFRSSNYLDLKKATGEPGVPNFLDNSSPDLHDEVTAQKKEFPIMVHVLLVIAALVFIFPGGYLFLRLFDRVWLHAGSQTLGLLVLLAGVAGGIVYHIKSEMTISYHQVLGIITTVLVLTAFTLGLISHHYFKRRKTSSPLLKYHRFIGPFSVVFGWGTIVSGFIHRDEPRRIIPFVVVLLAVIVFVGSIAFLMKKRAMRKKALVTPAAQNFNAGYYGQTQSQPPNQSGPAASYFAPPVVDNRYGHGEGVPMQTFGQQQYPQSYGYAQQPYKAPEVNVRPAF